MQKKLRRYGLLSKSFLFTVIIHGILLALLIYSFNWSNQIKRGGAKPIQAVVVSEKDILEEVKKQQLLEEQKIKEEEQAFKELEELTRKQEEEKKKLEELEKKREQEEQNQKELENKRKEEEKQKALNEEKKKAEAEKKRTEAEKKKEAEAESKRKEAEKKKKLEAEKKKKLEAEKKRKEAEKKKKLAAEKKRKEAEKRRRAEQLRKQLEQEQRVQTRLDAGNAMNALIDRIATAVERNWRRPQTSQTGLIVTVRVKVARDGRVISARVVKSSGDRFFDQSAETAVKKASPLPFPANPEYYEFINEFDFKFNPDEF